MREDCISLCNQKGRTIEKYEKLNKIETSGVTSIESEVIGWEFFISMIG